MFNKTKEDLDFNSWLEILKQGLNTTNCREDTISQFFNDVEEHYSLGYSVIMCLDLLVSYNRMLDWN